MPDAVSQLKNTNELLEKRGLPDALFSEGIVLGSILKGTVEFEDIRQAVNGSALTIDKHRTLYRVMAALSDEGAPVNLSSIAQRLKDEDKLVAVDGLSGLMDIYHDTPPVLDIDHHVNLISQRSKAHEFVGAVLGEIEKIVLGGDLYAAQDAIGRAALDKTEDATKEITMHSAAGVMGDSIQDFFARMPFGIATGVTQIDEWTNGFQRGELVVIGARPGDGKTALATQIALTAAVNQKKRVDIISLEMDNKQLMARMCCQSAAIPYHLVRSGQIGPEERTKLREAWAVIHEADLHMSDAVDWDLSKIRRFVKHQKQIGQDCEVVIVDYLQLMPVSAGQKNPRRDLELASITRGLKLMAKEFQVCFFLLSQLSRDGEKNNRKPCRSDLKDSGSIEADADAILLLWHDKGSETPSGRNSEVILEKQRNGPTGPCPAWFSKVSVTFTSG